MGWFLWYWLLFVMFWTWWLLVTINFHFVEKNSKNVLLNIFFCVILVKLTQVWNMRLSKCQHSITFLVSYAVKSILFCWMEREMKREILDFVDKYLSWYLDTHGCLTGEWQLLWLAYHNHNRCDNINLWLDARNVFCFLLLAMHNVWFYSPCF